MGSRAVRVFVHALMIVCAAIARRESNGRGGADARVAADEAAIAREWRNAIDPLRHDFTGVRGGYGRIVRHFEDVVAAHEPAASWRGERVVDIGCGGGWLGVWALMRGARHYVGVDASDASLATSRRTLTDAGFADGTQYELLGAAKAREEGYKGADVVVALKVMQHFPSLTYTEEWLRAVAMTGARRLVVSFAAAVSGDVSCRKTWSHGHAFNGARCFFSLPYLETALKPWGYAVAWSNASAPVPQHARWPGPTWVDVFAGFHRRRKRRQRQYLRGARYRVNNPGP